MLGRKFDRSAKTVVVGDSGVGKTCILFRFARNIFDENTPSTLGVEFMSWIVAREKRRIELQLWDTAGQELFRTVTRSYYHGSIGVFVVYDVTSRDSFDNVAVWLRDVHNTIGDNFISVLIGNKADLEEAREVKREEGEKFAEEQKMLFFETSAKTGEHIQDAINACVDGIEALIEEGKYDGAVNDMMTITDDEVTTGDRKSCC